MSRWAAQHEKARATVLATLADPALRKINYQVGSFRFSIIDYLIVSQIIKKRAIVVLYDRKAKGEACYYYKRNVLELGFYQTSEVTKRALIVHECMHAACDCVGHRRMNTETSEAAAYLAQCVYARQKTKDPKKRLYSTGVEDRIFLHAWDLAGRLLAGERLKNSAYDSLLFALRAHPDYKTRATKAAGYDGVRRL